ncbi:hypothetical protein T439DRAFT_349247 [Meredithblackwellia eburnea MCA 4105]
MKLSDAVIFSSTLKTDGARETVYRIDELSTRWTIHSAPNGGYTIALLVKACTQHQARSLHPDINSISASFLRSGTSGKSAEVRVEVLKTGAILTFLRAGLYQKSKLLLEATVVFSDLNPVERYPFPSHSELFPISSKYTFASELAWSEVEGSEVEEFGRQPKEQAGLEWGSWVQFKGEEKLGWEHLGFIGDLPKHGPDVLAYPERPNHWMPTLTMTIHFYVGPEELEGDTMFGVYSLSQFLKNGRHDTAAEVWTRSLPEKKAKLVLKTWQMSMQGLQGRNLGKL